MEGDRRKISERKNVSVCGQGRGDVMTLNKGAISVNFLKIFLWYYTCLQPICSLVLAVPAIPKKYHQTWHISRILVSKSSN
jgi:hypothetical protein